MKKIIAGLGLLGVLAFGSPVVADSNVTAQAIEIQSYLDDRHEERVEIGEDWTTSKGMLGLGVFGSFVATVVLYHLILIFIFGGIRGKKEDGKWWTPFNTRFVFEVGRAIGILNKAWCGIATPRGYAETSDGKFGRVSRELYIDAWKAAAAKMKEEGWGYKKTEEVTDPSYAYRTLDCENFAMKMKVEMEKYIADTAGDQLENLGIPISLIGYIIESGKNAGKGHVVVGCRIDGGPDIYFQPYWEVDEPLVLTQKEIDSINLSYT